MNETPAILAEINPNELELGDRVGNAYDLQDGWKMHESLSGQPEFPVVTRAPETLSDGHAVAYAGKSKQGKRCELRPIIRSRELYQDNKWLQCEGYGGRTWGDVPYYATAMRVYLPTPADFEAYPKFRGEQQALVGYAYKNNRPVGGTLLQVKTTEPEGIRARQPSFALTVKCHPERPGQHDAQGWTITQKGSNDIQYEYQHRVSAGPEQHGKFARLGEVWDIMHLARFSDRPGRGEVYVWLINVSKGETINLDAPTFEVVNVTNTAAGDLKPPWLKWGYYSSWMQYQVEESEYRQLVYQGGLAHAHGYPSQRLETAELAWSRLQAIAGEAGGPIDPPIDPPPHEKRYTIRVKGADGPVVVDRAADELEIQAVGQSVQVTEDEATS